MSAEQNAIYRVQTAQPDIDHLPLLKQEMVEPFYPRLSHRVEQHIHDAGANIAQSVILSEGSWHTLEEVELLVPEFEEIIESFHGRLAPLRGHLTTYKGVFDKTVDSLKRIINTPRHTHYNEASIGFRHGFNAGKDALLKVNPNSINQSAELEKDQFSPLHYQMLQLYGYYTAWEALRGKKTALNFHEENPFEPLVEIMSHGVRAFRFQRVSGREKFMMHLFVKDPEDAIRLGCLREGERNIREYHVYNRTCQLPKSA